MARQQGATDPEIDEVVAIAMTIGAHKIRLMAEKGKAAAGNAAVPEAQQRQERPGPT